MLKSTIFREYDIRGVADTELLSSDVVDLGRGLGTLLQRKSGRSITLGRDCRLSSPRLRDALLEGLVDSGCEVTSPYDTPSRCSAARLPISAWSRRRCCIFRPSIWRQMAP